MKRLTLIIVALMLVFSLACGLPTKDRKDGDAGDAPVEATIASKTEDSDSGASDAKTEEKDDDKATESHADDDTDKETASSDSLFGVDADALDQLASYRTEFVMSFQSADATTDGSMNVIQEVTTGPPSQYILMSMTGTFPGADELSEMATDEDFEVEVYVVENMQWLRFGEMWLESTVTEDNAFDADSLGPINDSFLDPDTLNSLADEGDLKFVTNEKVNGVQTRHYHAKYNSLWGNLGIGDGEIESGEADIWVAAESDLPKFVVRMVFDITGELDMGSEDGQFADGTMTFTMNVTKINEPITIKVPEAAKGGGVPEDIPAYPNATESNAFGTMIAISTEDDEETVKEFYNQALPESGWELGEENFMGSNWTKGERGLSLMITYDADTAITSILIMLDEGTDE